MNTARANIYINRNIDRDINIENIREVETSPVSVSQSPSNDKSKTNKDVQDVFGYWCEKLNHPHAKLDSKRKSKIQQALALGYRVDQLKLAIDGCKRSEFNMGSNPHKKVYDDLELILRDAAHIERFMSASGDVTSNADCYSTQHSEGAIL